jgi:hypothetical protein
MSANLKTRLSLDTLEAREVPAPLAFGWNPGAPTVPLVSELGACPSDPVIKVGAVPSDPVTPSKLGYVGAVPSDPVAPARGGLVVLPAGQRSSGAVSPLLKPGLVGAVPSDPVIKVGAGPIPTVSPSQELRGILLPSLVPVRGISPEINPGGNTNPEVEPTGIISPEFAPGQELRGILLPSLTPKGHVDLGIKTAENTNPELSSDQFADVASPIDINR